MQAIDLRNLSFEPGSRLTRIGRCAFASCLLRSIVIPASVTEICGGAFAGSGIREISIEDGNEHFCVIDEFLLDITQTSLISFSRLNFEPDSQLRRIERLAFGGCSSLHTILIPSSIESLDREWFLNCHFYGGVVFDTVQFESYESLSRIVHNDCGDLSGNISIEVLEWTDESMIPGYYVDTALSDTIVRLKRSSESESSG
jgi:hypothetical protein